LDANDCKASSLTSAMEPAQILSSRMARNWSSVVASMVMYCQVLVLAWNKAITVSFGETWVIHTARSFHSNLASSSHSSIVSANSGHLSPDPNRYSASPYSLIAKKAPLGPHVTSRGGPARHPAGVSHPWIIPSSAEGRPTQRMKVASHAMNESFGPRKTRR